MSWTQRGRVKNYCDQKSQSNKALQFSSSCILIGTRKYLVPSNTFFGRYPIRYRWGLNFITFPFIFKSINFSFCSQALSRNVRYHGVKDMGGCLGMYTWASIQNYTTVIIIKQNVMAIASVIYTRKRDIYKSRKGYRDLLNGFLFREQHAKNCTIILKHIEKPFKLPN